ncbi:MAG: 50S ribosomal protein L4, partial [Oribacterium sp.]
TILSARNIEDVKTAQVNEINVYDVMKYGTVLATKAALEKLEEVYA